MGQVRPRLCRFKNFESPTICFRRLCIRHYTYTHAYCDSIMRYEGMRRKDCLEYYVYYGIHVYLQKPGN